MNELLSSQSLLELLENDAAVEDFTNQFLSTSSGMPSGLHQPDTRLPDFMETKEEDYSAPITPGTCAAPIKVEYNEWRKQPAQKMFAGIPPSHGIPPQAYPTMPYKIPIAAMSKPMDTPKKPTVAEKNLDTLEKQKVRQRVRRLRINQTLDTLKTLLPSADSPSKMDQSQLLEMTVEYIQQLKSDINSLQKENAVLRSHSNFDNVSSCTETSEEEHSESDNFSEESFATNSSSPDFSHTTPTSTSSPNIPTSPLPNPQVENIQLSTIRHRKRRLSDMYKTDVDFYELEGDGRPPKLVSGARMVMCLFLFTLILYNPLSYSAPSSVLATSAEGAGMGRVPLTTDYGIFLPTSETMNWMIYLIMSIASKVFMLLMWVFGALLLDHAYVPSEKSSNAAKYENDQGVKKFDRGDYEGSRVHFQRALHHLGYRTPFGFNTRLFHIPLEIVRQVTHLLRIGLWCDGYLVALRGAQKPTMEIARANHYLFTLHVLSNSMDSHSILHFLVSLNAAESLHQKPPLLAEVYATVGLALYGICSMQNLYKLFLAKAWSIVNSHLDDASEQSPASQSSSVDSTIAYLLFLSSYGTLCEGNLKQAEDQISESTALWEKKGNISMYRHGQFLLAYTSFVRSDYHRSIALMDRTNINASDDPRLIWWKETVLACSSAGIGEPVDSETVNKLSTLYSKVPFAPLMEMMHFSVQAYLRMHLGEYDTALRYANKALNTFENSFFSGWIFYCGYYIGEVLFSLCEMEQKAQPKNERLVHHLLCASQKLCCAMRHVARGCDLAKPISQLTQGRYALLTGDNGIAVQHFKLARTYAEELGMSSYVRQADEFMNNVTAEEERCEETAVCGLIGLV